jgi:hypothetical protein
MLKLSANIQIKYYIKKQNNLIEYQIKKIIIINTVKILT